MPTYDENVHGDDYDYNPAAVESPSDAVVDAYTHNRRIQNPDDVIGLCSECKSEMPNSYMENNIFAQQGVPVPCKFCGGVVVIVYREVVNRGFLDSFDLNRGIGFG